ncbi:MAG: carboxypeptidase-like regulatory domain-containing protein [Bacteroidota bacterium]
MLKRLELFILFILFSVSVFAQSPHGVIKGFVYDKSTGEPMIYTTVYLAGTNIGVQTDVNGYFSIAQITPGTYKLQTTFVGYDTATISVTVKANDVISKKLFLNHQDQQLKGVEISAKKTEKATQVKAGVTTITPREMKLMPSAGGEPDIAQYLQVMPGVVFTGDQGGQLYIRGGSPVQTGILLDGVTIYNPFHSIGLYSVFETDAIRSADVLTAGFNAEYGNRTSAIVDIHTKDGNRNEISGKVSASPIMVRAMLEGPIAKPKTEDGGSTTFLLSIKNSYLDQTSKSLYGSLGEPFKSGLPYSFTDMYGKITFSGGNGSKLNLFGFKFDDGARILNDSNRSLSTADLHWTATGFGTTFVVTPGNSATLINGKFAYSNYNIDYNEATSNPRNSSIGGFEAGINFTNFLKGYSELKYGLEVSGNNTALTYYNTSQVSTILTRENTTASLFFVFRKNFSEKLVLEPSLRVQYYSSISKMSPEPRIGLKYNLSDNIRLKAAAGMYSQNVISTKSDRDIVNFFTGFILSPDQSVKNLNGDVINYNLQTAYHLLGGIEVDIKEVELNLEPWYKNFNQNIELNRNKQLPGDADFSSGDGVAYGLDLSAKYSHQRVYLWGVVSYQNVTYRTIDDAGNIQSYPPPFDRRWNINLLGSYAAGKKKDWEFSTRFNMGSPFPFTQTQGFYENVDPTKNGISTNSLQTNGNVGILYANAINGGRLSYYHRLDISVKKKFILNKKNSIEGTFSMTNVYNRNNIFYVNRIENVLVYQLPVFPSLSAVWNF